MSLLVKRPGLLTTVQDLGRYGAQKYGVIVSGAVDRLALRLANLLVGNEENAACLEMTIIGPEIVLEQPVLIAICGADLSPTLDGNPLPRWKTIAAPGGSVLKFGKPQEGCRAYLAVGGGLDVAAEMNSRSTYLRAQIGGFQGRALQEGDRIPLGSASERTARLQRLLTGAAAADSLAVSRWSVAQELIPAYSPQPVLHVTAGQEYELFDQESQYRFFHEPFTVLAQSDRMGYRLQGSGLQLAEPKEMLSSAVTFGTVQVPPDGNPIVLMADHQTTGGYPKIAQVISTDLPLLAQVNLGGKVGFQLLDLREAQQRALAQQAALRTLQLGLRQLVH
ncbi:biotin-dependent carboxyltransferase family protein [Paenibacillus sp. GCM10027626]|uniref:5-oxoprolinase subunit C family protein n=1 Tax=Paenibacillus sp. GCM10027626 TaxID=3273411 RepID=UPI003628F86A